MKIGIDARWIFRETSGIGAYTGALIRALVQYAPEHSYTLFFHDPVCRERMMTDPAVKASEDRCRDIMLPFNVFSPRSQIGLPGILRDERIDVFHSTNYMIPLPAFPRRRNGKIKAAVTIHDVIPLLFPDAAPKSLKRRFFFLYRRLMTEIGHRAHAVISDSETSRRDVIRMLNVPPERLTAFTAIPCGVDTNRFKPLPAGTPENSGQDDRRPRGLLYVGRADPYKNLIGLLHALKEARAACPFPIRLQIAGPPDPRYPQARRTARELGLEQAVSWTGYLDEQQLVDAYRNADLLVLPSYYEGFGLPVIEAMACGTPVVCSNRGSLPEVAGEAASIVDPDESGALAGAITRVLTEPELRRHLIRAGLQRAQSYSWKETALATVRVYERIYKQD